ncbi:Arylsulfatase A [Saccharicrinis carchari]|uniref:Arylsulfatase A n=1 Tax=Saccharicrinis carchari TaxID=1168039 RepID=A0A521CGJ7_SACCC|nr:sulfatase [Saccharicrinis carchari]SMO57860.1 Arylsulfatase A [Saccharicrinis carchari]
MGFLIGTACTNGKQNKPNIILFMVDDMGWQDTSVPFWTEKTHFNKRYHTPNMERLAEQGMKFTQAYACAVCSPTRVSLMTGMNAARHRVTNWTLHKNTMQVNPPQGLRIPQWNVNGIGVDKDLENAVYTSQPLPKVLQLNGYTTIHCGKAHFGATGTKASDPTNIGFTVNIAGHAAGAPASYLGIHNYAKNKSSVWDVPGLEEFHGREVFLTEALTQKAIRALEQAVEEDKPFFLYMAHYAVHTPIMGDKRFEQKYLDAGLHPIEAKYASLIEGMDKSLGDIMNYIEAKGISDNTVILFMSDNGGLSALGRGGEKHTHNYPLSSGKGSIHEGGIREPMIVKWPGKVKPQSQCNEYLIIEDFYPTILQIAGVQQLDGECQPIDGLSFVDKLKDNGADDGGRPLFWHYPNNWGPSGPGIGTYSAIRKGDWKLIYYYTDTSFELFNINNDIGEHINLAAKNPLITQALAKELSAYLRKVGAQLPLFKATNKMVPYPDESTEIIKETNWK